MAIAKTLISFVTGSVKGRVARKAVFLPEISYQIKAEKGGVLRFKGNRKDSWRMSTG